MECIEQVAVCAVIDAHTAFAVHADQQQMEAVEYHCSQRISACLNRVHLARCRAATGDTSVRKIQYEKQATCMQACDVQKVK
jgi:hypothetical protein